MSVNGDLMVIRNGRSTSQVSVYNYPEHLNPFYEDDNHKRLRFWQINKSSKDGQGRRNSFSLGGLKDMWAFKSFRLKKKSSSLGINKTSESPPPLRRDVYNNNNGYNTYDPRMRYTTGATNGTLASNNAFQRNAPYRSSLQDMRNTQPDPLLNGIGFNRNDRYRSTIQPASTSGTPSQTLNIPTSRRYVYRGSVTPQPVRNNHEFNSDTLGMISHGSSQISVASTNPFDEDDNDDVVMGGNSASSTPAKHPARKKRRAPPPPIPVHQIIKEESSSAGSTPSHKPSTTQLKITEPNEDERLEIHNLTAEIENFVKSSNTDSPENHEVRPSNSNKQNGSIPTRDSITTVHTIIDIRTVPNEEPLFIREDQDLRIEETPVKVQPNEVKQIGQVEAIHIRTETPRSTPERIESSGVSSFRSQTKPEPSEKNTISSGDSVVKVSETVKETPEKSKPLIAAKPKVPKSPPPVSPKLMVSSREMILTETPDTPAMRRKEIRTVEVINSSPETPHREVGIDVVPQRTSAPSRQEVTIQVTRIVPMNDDAKKQDSPSEPTPVPVKRVEKHLPTENTPPLPEINKVVEKASESSPGTSSKTEVKLERKSSNREEDLPSTISELQLIISEIKEVADRVEESAIQQTEEPDNIHPQPVAAITPPSTSRELPSPPPIQKPPRTKHITEEINENIYRPRPSQWKQSTLAPLEPVPPEKRRSVKQIIESINRNQQRLGVAKKEEIEIDANNPQRNQSETNTNAMEQNLKSLAESQREMKRMLLELEGLQNAHEQKLSNKNDENFQGILDTIVSTLAKETGKNTNGEVFKKCTVTKEVNNVSRESSPTTSNLDWNPLPKPKRTNKNLSPELPVKRNNKDE